MYTIGNLHNLATNRHHPILFRESPLPGNPENLVRSKSAGHHTVGFDTREESIAECQSMAKRLDGADLCIDSDFSWDGNDIPAMVAFFSKIDGKVVPTLF